MAGLAVVGYGAFRETVKSFADKDLVFILFSKRNDGSAKDMHDLRRVRMAFPFEIGAKLYLRPSRVGDDVCEIGGVNRH